MKLWARRIMWVSGIITVIEFIALLAYGCATPQNLSSYVLPSFQCRGDGNMTFVAGGLGAITGSLTWKCPAEGGGIIQVQPGSPIIPGSPDNIPAVSR